MNKLTFPWSRERPRGRGYNYNKADRLATILEPHGTNQNALVTSPRYGWATKLHHYCIYIVTQKSKMAAANANFFQKFNKPITQIVCKIAAQCQRLYPYCFTGPRIQWSNFLHCEVRAKVKKNPRWRLSKS